MLRTGLKQKRTFLLLPLVVRISFERLDHIYNPHILGYIICNTLADDCFTTTIWAAKYSSICLDCQSQRHAFFTKGMPTFGHNSRSTIVEIELIMADSAMRSYFFSCLIIHFFCNDNFKIAIIRINS